MPAAVPIITGILAGASVYGTLGLSAAIAIGAFTIATSFLLQPDTPRSSVRQDRFQNIDRAAVAPQRYVLGRARVSGQLIRYKEQKVTERNVGQTIDTNTGTERVNVTHPDSPVAVAVLVLSEGECEAIDRVWIDGVEMPIDPVQVLTSTVPSVPLLPTIGPVINDSGFNVFPRIQVIVPRANNNTNGSSTVWFRYNVGTGNFTTGMPGGRGSIGRREILATQNAIEMYAFLNGGDGQVIPRGKTSLVVVVKNRPFSEQEVANQATDQQVFPYSRFPKIEVLLKGMRLDISAWNGTNVPVYRWTDNAALIRYWWHTERRGYPDYLMDIPSLRTAVDICDQLLFIESLPVPQSGDTYMDEPYYEVLSGEYGPDITDWPALAELQETVRAWNRAFAAPRGFGRYTINGVVTSDMDVRQVETAFDVAWAGSVVEHDGRLRFLPGVITEPISTITMSDLISVPKFQLQQQLSQIANAVEGSIDASEFHDWQEYSLASLDDAGAISNDGARYPATLESMHYVANPINALYIQQIELRKLRLARRIELEIWYGEQFKFFALHVGSTVTLDLPDFDMSGNWTIQERSLTLGGTVKLQLTPLADDLYDFDRGNVYRLG